MKRIRFTCELSTLLNSHCRTAFLCLRVPFEGVFVNEFCTVFMDMRGQCGCLPQTCSPKNKGRLLRGFWAPFLQRCKPSLRGFPGSYTSVLHKFSLYSLSILPMETPGISHGGWAGRQGWGRALAAPSSGFWQKTVWRCFWAERKGVQKKRGPGRSWLRCTGQRLALRQIAVIPARSRA